jgi:hypothetical protein
MKDLTEIASISGKGGLFRVIKPGRVGVILESLDEKKIKIATNPNHKVSILADISIYTNTDEGSIPLEEVLRKINKEFGEDPGLDSKSTPDELMSFIEYIIPEYDESRVYPSDIKKLVNWYKILLKEAPEFFVEDSKEKKVESSEDKESKSTEKKEENKNLKETSDKDAEKKTTKK